MKRFFLLVIVTLSLLFSLNTSYAQEKYDLQNRNAHYYFTTTVAGEKADIMLESGIPAMLVEREFYEKVLKNTELVFEPSESQIRLLDKLYKIPFRSEGKVAVGNLIFDGPVFILDGFSGISMPIQYLKTVNGKKTFIALDFHGNTMSVSNQNPEVNGEKYKLRIDKKMGFPIVRSVLKMNTETGSATLKGDFIVDFGNPELLFLMKQSKTVERAIQKGNLDMIDVISGKSFEVIGKAIRAQKLVICGRTFNEKSIVVTDKMPAIKQVGFLGVPFFEQKVVFDFAGGVMIVQ